jgi:hypothetical protein
MSIWPEFPLVLVQTGWRHFGKSVFQFSHNLLIVRDPLIVTLCGLSGFHT